MDIVADLICRTILSPQECKQFIRAWGRKAFFRVLSIPTGIYSRIYGGYISYLETSPYLSSR